MGDDMKNKLYKVLVLVFYVLSLFILLFCLKIRLTSRLYIYTHIRLILVLISSLLIYTAGYILVKKLNHNKKILKINLIIYFIIYTITIITLTLFDEIFGRNGIVLVNWNRGLLNNYLNNSFNIIPFDTIKLFINGYRNGVVTQKDFLINIYGNFVVFMPYGLFIPLIFKRINKYYKFLIFITIFVIMIELLQFLTLSGSCDIDDLILNVMGASIIYFICKINFIKKIIKKIFLFE